ncbi:MAG: hypothetical protein ABJF10_10345 [Chthoniobacter sp.]|uniref:hypothetical protein n=1 Tax=Chthoniobacter sp. TaxID=2510640 RepID=UPI0032A2682C
MSDEIPPAPSESTEDATKAETIRITLPPKPEQPTAKRETVRINLPGKPASTPPLSGTPKKETTKIPPADAGLPPPTAGKPFVPPPPKPPMGSGALKPVSGINPPPKPPSLGAKPTVPLKPAAPPSSGVKPVSSGVNAPPEPVTQKAASPKKETARITLPPEGGKPALPKATIKMQQTQPLVKQPGASQSSLQPVPQMATTMAAAPAEAEPDGLVSVLSIAALLISLVSLGLVFWAYSASNIS